MLKDKIRKDNTYRTEKDLVIDVEGVSVGHLPPVQSHKYIILTPEFEERTPEDQKVFLWSLASSMNEALHTMQRERNEVIDKLHEQERLIIQLQKQNIELSQALQHHMQSLNDAANARAAELHKVKQDHQAELKRLRG